MLRSLLLQYFSELPDDLREIVSEVYTLEREYSDMENPRNIKLKIRDVIDEVANYRLHHLEEQQ